MKAKIIKKRYSVEDFFGSILDQTQNRAFQYLLFCEKEGFIALERYSFDKLYIQNRKNEYAGYIGHSNYIYKSNNYGLGGLYGKVVKGELLNIEEILQTIGSNFFLLNKLLNVDVLKPYIRIEESKSEAQKVLAPFELQDKIGLTPQIEALFAKNTTLCWGQDSNLGSP